MQTMAKLLEVTRAIPIISVAAIIACLIKVYPYDLLDHAQRETLYLLIECVLLPDLNRLRIVLRRGNRREPKNKPRSFPLVFSTVCSC